MLKRQILSVLKLVEIFAIWLLPPLKSIEKSWARLNVFALVALFSVVKEEKSLGIKS